MAGAVRPLPAAESYRPAPGTDGAGCRPAAEPRAKTYAGQVDEQQARRELRTALKRRRRQQWGALGLLIALVIGSGVVAATSYAAQGTFSGEQLLPLFYGALTVVVWRAFLRPTDLTGPLVACRVAHPSGTGGTGLRFRRPDGALLGVRLSDDKGAPLNPGDELWLVDPREGRRVIGFTWNRLLQRSEPVASVTPARLLLPPGSVPRAYAYHAPQDSLPAASPRETPPRPMAIRPLGPPPLATPDGIDEDQARWALRHGVRGKAAPPREVPLEVVTVDSPPPSPYASRTQPITVRRADGRRSTWTVTMDTWPERGSTAWAGRVDGGDGDGERVWLVVPTCVGDVLVVAPRGPARPAEPDRS